MYTGMYVASCVCMHVRMLPYESADTIQSTQHDVPLHVTMHDAACEGYVVGVVIVISLYY